MEQNELNNVARSMAEWANSTETVVSSLIDTPLFPVRRPELSLGSNSKFPTTALPYNPEFGLYLSAPTPDFSVGYSVGARGPRSAKEAGVYLPSPCTGLHAPGDW